MKGSNLRVLFIHGLESSPQSSKALFLKEHFEALTPSMDTSDFAAAVERQAEHITRFAPDVVVGSSFGGAVLLKLLQHGVWRGPTVLLAPAHRHYSVVEQVPENVPVIIAHGTRDDVVRIEDSRGLAKTGTHGSVRLIEVDDEHRLQSLVQSGRLAELVREAHELGITMRS